ncbi:MAG: Gfo/Idh/MocA family oxidoreductase [Chitinophagaceae bacterium]|nr:Gfo/Idh/MocA family oxidoreductase [Chitinophagaceae bacterium]
METVQWGIIGCGDVTEKKSGPAFNKVPHSRLVAVMRRDREKAKNYAQRHGISKWYNNAQELIDDVEVNAIYVATPPLYHEEYTILALKARKPVYVEKPMSVNTASAEKMMTASYQEGTKLSIAHYRRQQQLFKKIKSLIDADAIGNVRLVNLKLFQGTQPGLIAQTETNWRVDPKIAGGGLFHDLAPHQLDLMLHFFGTPLEAAGISLKQGNLYQADDLVTGFIRFENGIVFNGIWCFTVPAEEECDDCEIIGSEGSIRFSVFKQQEILLTKKNETEIFRFELLEHVQQPMIDSVVKYFMGVGPNPCSAEEGVETMRLMEVFTKKK